MIEASTQEQRFADTPEGWAQRWRMEFDAARKEHSDWQEKGRRIVDRFLDRREGKNMLNGVDTRWNLYTSSIQTKRAMLYGKIPSVDVRPRFADATDSVARLAGELLERVLNSDIERDEDNYRDALDYCLMDRLNPGAAIIRFRYVPEIDEPAADAPPTKAAVIGPGGQELAPEVPAAPKKVAEEVETVYVHWTDVLWGPCRTFQEMPWCAFASDLTKEDVSAKFGDEVADKIGFNSTRDGGSGTDARRNDPWTRARIWEIWDKQHRCVWFFSEAHNRVLQPLGVDDAEMGENGSQKDPLGLTGFWPFPRPWLANVTTSAFVPRADFTIYQDLLDEVDRVSTRITELERAIGAKGVYDKTAAPALGRILTEAQNNQMLPVDNWPSFSEKGGLSGCFELLPLDGIVLALDKLREYRQELIQAYYQVSGDSDLSRGQQIENGTPGEAQIKAKFASVRMQALQDEFSRFASDAQKVRAEIIARHFEPESILARSNIQHSFDADNPGLVMQAIQLIKSDVSCYRIEVKPESLSLTDFDAMKSERMEVLAGLGAFIQSAAPFVQLLPGSTPYLLKLLQFAMSSMRGAADIQGVLDQAIAHASQLGPQQSPQGPPQPDPKLLANQQKAQADMQKIQATTQGELVRMQAETQQLAQRKATDAAINVREAAAKRAIQGGGAAPMPPTPPLVPGGVP